MIGIYKITNMLNDLSYIGQSVDITRRWNDHRSRAFNEKSKDYYIPLYKEIRKYGINNFKFEVIEECTKEQLNEKEQYWINFYDSFFNGYNESVGGSIHCRRSNISKEKIIGVINDLKNTNMLHREIAERWDISAEMVQGINTGRYWKHNILYPIQKRVLSFGHACNNANREYKTKEAYIHKCKTCGKDFETYDKNQIYCSHECCSLSQRKVERPSKDELLKLIKTTSFLQIGKLYGVSDNAVRKWCKYYELPYKQKEIKYLKD